QLGSRALLLIDDQDGRLLAQKRGLAVIGTLGILAEAGEAGFLDLPATLLRLQATKCWNSQPPYPIVAERLAEIGRRVVVIESDPQGRRLGALRRAGHHVIVADATADAVLDVAGIGRAAGVMALTDSDAVNLHVALLVRADRADLPVVLRVESPELSAHVARTRDAIALSPLAIAADEFVAAARSAAKNVH
ncbi:MAG: NAD-binding protein, partial [Vicinamibacteria bacterium]